MRTKRTNLLLGLGFGLGALAVVAPRPVAAQTQSTDSRWLPWLGCWQAEGAPADAGLLCVRPAEGQSSVEILRVTGSDVVSREVVWADGQRHETSREGCDGWEEGVFSQDGQRLFLNSNHTCEGGLVRDGGGIMTMVSPVEWLDVRYVGMGDDHTPWVQRYEAASDQRTEAAGMADILADRAWSVRTARMNAATPPSVDDIIEASNHEPSEVVEAWVAERQAPLAINAKELTRMADAGVASEVIDIAVAVSYPSRFHVTAQRAQPETGTDDRSTMLPSRLFPTYGYYDPFYYRYGYDPYYGYGSGSGLGGGYGYYGGYGYGYGYSPVIVISTPSTSTGSHGRVIAGRGYTRGSSGSTTGGSAGAARAPTSGSAGAAGSSRGSSGSSGRTAHRRGGGGGGM